MWALGRAGVLARETARTGGGCGRREAGRAHLRVRVEQRGARLEARVLEVHDVAERGVGVDHRAPAPPQRAHERLHLTHARERRRQVVLRRLDHHLVEADRLDALHRREVQVVPRLRRRHERPAAQWIRRWRRRGQWRRRRCRRCCLVCRRRGAHGDRRILVGHHAELPVALALRVLRLAQHRRRCQVLIAATKRARRVVLLELRHGQRLWSIAFVKLHWP